MAMSARTRETLEALTLRVGAILVSMFVFSIFLICCKTNPIEVYAVMYKGAFGTSFSIQNTLQRAAPLILAALCTALPSRLGMVIIGGEGALVIGGLCAAIAGLMVATASPIIVLITMAIAGATAGGLWIMLAGGLKYFRGVNETISSLLLNYIAIAILNHVVEGPMRDPLSLNKPSTPNIGEANMLGHLPGIDVHWGLAYGVVACLVLYVLISHTTFGFAMRTVGGNIRAARIVGLSVGQLTLITCFLAGAAAGVAGMVEVAAVHGAANASLASGYGYTGILVSFIARHNPLAIMPVAVLLGGIGASSGLLQRRHHLPDATVQVLQGIMFIVILASESLYGRFKIFQAPVDKSINADKPPAPVVPTKLEGVSVA